MPAVTRTGWQFPRNCCAILGLGSPSNLLSISQGQFPSRGSSPENSRSWLPAETCSGYLGSNPQVGWSTSELTQASPRPCQASQASPGLPEAPENCPPARPWHPYSTTLNDAKNCPPRGGPEAHLGGTRVDKLRAQEFSGHFIVFPGLL